MNKTEMLLTIAAEECNETAQRISKAIRFTLEEIQPGQELTNAERILYEFNDLCAVMKVLGEEGAFGSLDISQSAWQSDKIEKIKKYMKYSEDIGTLSV